MYDGRIISSLYTTVFRIAAGNKKRCIKIYSVRIHLFNQINGISPWEYITIKRVEMAINILKTSDMSKLEIAERCGFSSSSNFYKAFLKIIGKHPKDFCR